MVKETPQNHACTDPDWNLLISHQCDHNATQWHHDMDQKLLVMQTLTEKMIEAGRNLLRLLTERRFPVRAALWLYLSEAREWTLVLAVPKARAEGKMKSYKQIQSVLAKGAGLPPLSIIMVVDAKDPLVYSAGPAVKVGNAGGHMFSQGTINGRSFDDAYIYPLAA